MGPLFVAVILLILGFAILALELFLPSGGVLAVLCVLCGIGSILFGFRHSYAAGTWMLLIILAVIPTMLWLFIRLWPHTPLGRKILIGLPDKQSYTWSSGATVKDVQQLIGRIGQAETDLLPAGSVEIEGRKFEAFCESHAIEAGSRVRVLRIDMGRLVVAAFEETLTSETRATQPVDPNDMLQRPIDELGLESLEEE